MNQRYRTLHLVLASSASVAIIICSYVFSGPFSFRPSSVDAATAEALLKSYASKDSDADGLPDWQESLYGTDPANPESVKIGVKDGDAVAQGLVKPKFQGESPDDINASDVPGALPADNSLTAQFSQEFLKAYVAAGGQNMSEAQKDALIKTLLANFTERAGKVLDSTYTRTSIKVDASVSIVAYAGAVESVLVKNDVPKGQENPIDLMDLYINKGDASAQTKLVALAKSYQGTTKGLLLVKVPPSQLDAHLTLIKSFDSLAKSTLLVANYTKDPVAVLGALTLYQPASTDIVEAFTSISKAIVVTGQPQKGAPGFIIVDFIRNLESQ